MKDSSEMSPHYLANVKAWGNTFGQFCQDTLAATLRFLPDGIEGILDRYLIKIPKLGNLFSNAWLSKFIKAFSGIILLQVIAADLGRFIAYPIGFVLGLFIGSIFSLFKLKAPVYQNRLVPVVTSIAPQTILGALGGAFFYLFYQRVLLLQQNESIPLLIFFMVLGSLFGFIAKLAYMVASNLILSANAATIRKNVARAKDLSSKLKAAARHKAKVRIVKLAYKTILQINGSVLQKKMNSFFSAHFDIISFYAYKKIDRHINYLTDRACHGDIQALKRLYAMVPNQKLIKNADEHDLDKMVERIFNRRTTHKICDDIDTVYDVWQYRDLQKNPTQNPILTKLC